MKTNKLLSGFGLQMLAAFALTSSFASANTIIATGVDWNRGGSILIQEDCVATQTYFAGVIYIQVSADGQQYNRDSLCVDLFTDIYISQTYDTTILHPFQVSGKNLERVSWLVDNALLPTQDPTYASALPSSDWVTNSVQGEGIQFAIWDIVHDAGDGFSAGRVQAVADPANPTPADVVAWAQTYEALSLGKSSDLAFIYKNVDFGNGQPAQMLAGPRFADGGPTPNPEPATFILAGAALIAIARFGRRYNKNAR